jgi:hypothetical protein
MTTGDSTSGKMTGDSASGSSGKKGDRQRNYQPRDNDKDGKRTARRYNNDNYCWTCGFDISHTSSTCKWITDTDNHKKEATEPILWEDLNKICSYEPHDGVGGT